MDNYYDYDDIANTTNAFAFLVFCPLVILIWDSFHLIFGREGLFEQDVSNDEDYHSSLEANLHEMSESTSEIEQVINEVQIDPNPPVIDNNQEASTSSGEDLNESISQEASISSKEEKKKSTSGTPSQDDSTTSEESEGPPILTTYTPRREPTSLNQSNGEPKEANLNQEGTGPLDHAQGESGLGSSSRKLSTSAGPSGGNQMQGFSSRDVADSSRIDGNNVNRSNVESKATGSSNILSPIRFPKVKSMPGLHQDGRFLGGSGVNSKEEASLIFSVFQAKVQYLERMFNDLETFKQTDSLGEEAGQVLAEAQAQFHNSQSSENYEILKDILERCIADASDFSESVSCTYLHMTWGRVYKSLEEISSKLIPLLYAIKQNESGKKKKRAISPNSSLLRETQSWTEKKKVKSPILEEEQGKTRTSRSHGHHAPTPGTSASTSVRRKL